MRNQNNIFANIDWWLVILYFILMVTGWLSIYASTYDEAHGSIFDFSQKYGKQFIWICSSVILALVILITDGKFYSTFSYFVYLFAIILLVIVLLFGKEVAGSKSWLALGSVLIQPSEFAKFATNLALAKYLSGLNLKIQELKTKIVAGIIVTIPVMLILLQSDAGSALVYASFILVVYRFGLSGNILVLAFLSALMFILALIVNKIILIGLLSLLAALFILFVWNYKKNIKKYVFFSLTMLVISSSCIYGVDYVFYQILKPHQQSRINILLGIEDDPLGAGYNVNQSKIAIGSGGFFGKGFLEGTQTKYEFVPEQSTDFIFCTIGEEHGFVGSLIIILLFMIFLLRIINIAERQRSNFTRIYGYGVVSILFIHLTINIGMTIGLAPVIGIPFPFFSYGGSSLWAFTILLFVFIKLDAYRMQIFR